MMRGISSRVLAENGFDESGEPSAPEIGSELSVFVIQHDTDADARLLFTCLHKKGDRVRHTLRPLAGTVVDRWVDKGVIWVKVECPPGSPVPSFSVHADTVTADPSEPSGETEISTQ